MRARSGRWPASITPTYAVATPSSGWHLYYTAPAGVALRNTHDVIGYKIDTRAHGGYIVAPGSPVPPDGYALVDDREPVELPGWVTPRPHSRAAHDGLSARCGRRCQPQRLHHRPRLRGEARRVRTAPPGQHNAVLCRAAYALGQLVGAGLLDQDTARAELTTAASALIGADCDCTPREVARVIAAGLAAGTRNPRRTTTRTSPRRAA